MRRFFSLSLLSACAGMTLGQVVWLITWITHPETFTFYFGVWWKSYTIAYIATLVGVATVYAPYYTRTLSQLLRNPLFQATSLLTQLLIGFAAILEYVPKTYFIFSTSVFILLGLLYSWLTEQTQLWSRARRILYASISGLFLYSSIFLIQQPQLDSLIFLLGVGISLYTLAQEYITNSFNTHHRSTQKTPYLFLLFLVTLGGALLRLWNLGLPSFALDEFLHVVAANSHRATGTFALISGVEYTRATLFTFLVSLSTHFGTSELYYRLPSVFFGIATIPLLYATTTILLKDRRVALIAATLLAASEWSVGWSRMVRMYTAHQFFFVLSILLLYLFIEKTRTLQQRILLGAALALCTGIALNLHDAHLLFFPTIGAYVVFLAITTSIQRKTIRNNGYAKAVFLGILAIAIVSIFKPFWRIIPLENIAYIPESIYYYRNFFYNFLQPVYLFAILGLFIGMMKYGKGILLILLTYVIPYVLLMLPFISMKSSRYLFFTFPSMLVLAAIPAALSLEWTQRTMRNKRLGALLGGILCMMVMYIQIDIKQLAFLTSGKHGHPVEGVNNANWKKAYDVVHQDIAKNQIPKDKVRIASTIPLSGIIYFDSVDIYLRKELYEENTLSIDGVTRDVFSYAEITRYADEWESYINKHPGSTLYVVGDSRLYQLNTELQLSIFEKGTLLSKGKTYTVYKIYSTAGK